MLQHGRPRRLDYCDDASLPRFDKSLYKNLSAKRLNILLFVTLLSDAFQLPGISLKGNLALSDGRYHISLHFNMIEFTESFLPSLPALAPLNLNPSFFREHVPAVYINPLPLALFFFLWGGVVEAPSQSSNFHLFGNVQQLFSIFQSLQSLSALQFVRL